MQVKISIFHNLAAGSDLQPLALSTGQSPDHDPARHYLPGDPMARVFEGYVGVTRQGSEGTWIDAFHQAADPAGQQSAELVSLAFADIYFILGWVSGMTGNHVRAMLGPQREAGCVYHGRNLRPLTRGDVVVIGEVPFVAADRAKWEQMSLRFREVRHQAGRTITEP